MKEEIHLLKFIIFTGNIITVAVQGAMKE